MYGSSSNISNLISSAAVNNTTNENIKSADDPRQNAINTYALTKLIDDSKNIILNLHNLNNKLTDNKKFKEFRDNIKSFKLGTMIIV